MKPECVRIPVLIASGVFANWSHDG